MEPQIIFPYFQAGLNAFFFFLFKRVYCLAHVEESYFFAPGKFFLLLGMIPFGKNIKFFGCFGVILIALDQAAIYLRDNGIIKE